VVEKDERVFDKLALHCKGERDVKPLSPTALSDYIECRLRFYFKYVAKIREAKEVEDELDARMMGNFLHDTMQLFYEQIIRVNNRRTIEAADLENYERSFGPIIDRVFRKAYSLDESKPVAYDGQRLVVREVVKSFVDKIIEMDKNHAPFTIEAIERDDLKYSIALAGKGNPVVVLGGKVDRVDKKGNLLRVIDYKTGKDKTDIKKGVEDLFVRDGERNKAAFQTILYAMLYKPQVRDADVRILPGLMNRMNLFEEDFQFGLKIGKEYIDDIRPMLPEFESHLKTMLEELFNPDVPFDQTTDVKQCKICAYQGICYR
jgi:RecB family exonuclease